MRKFFFLSTFLSMFFSKKNVKIIPSIIFKLFLLFFLYMGKQENGNIYKRIFYNSIYNSVYLYMIIYDYT